MGNHLVKKGSSVPVGKANLNTLAKGIRVNVLDQVNGPFTAPAAGEATTVLATDLWKDQVTVVHLLRRFG